MQFIKLTKGTDAIKIFNNFGFFKLSTESGGEPELEATPSLVYTLSSDGTYYIVGTGFTSIEAIEADTSGGTNGSGLDSTWTGGQLVIPAEHNGLPVKAIAPRALATIKNITEMYIYDGITNIGHRAFQCATDNGGYDTTMKACRLPETLISLGGTTSSNAGRVFWGRQGLDVLNIPESVDILPLLTFAYFAINTFITKKPVGFIEQCFSNVQTIKNGTIKFKRAPYCSLYQQFMNVNSSIDYKTTELDVIFTQPDYINNNNDPTLSSAFKGAHLRSVMIDSTLKKLGYDYIAPASTASMFEGANVQNVEFQLTRWDEKEASRAFYKSVVDRLRLPNITSFYNNTTFSPNYTTLPKKIFFGASSCTLRATYMSPQCFIKPDYIDNYYSATNWTSFFVNDGNEEPQMRVYREYASGDALPTQIGTTQVYNVTWYEDDDFTTLAGATATANKEYYGKISAVV